MSIRKRNSDSGMAMLEAAGAMIVLLVLLMGVFAMVEYMRLSRSLAGIIDKNIYDTAIKPYKVVENFNGQPFYITLNQQVIKDYIESATENMAAELLPYLRRVTATEDPKFALDVSFTEMKVDTNSGAYLNMNSSSEVAPFLNSDPKILANLNSNLDMDQKFLNYAERSNEGGAVYAAPKASFGLGKTNDIYLPSNVLIGARAGISLEDTLLGNLLEVIGVEPYISDFKIITLRGEISDET